MRIVIIGILFFCNFCSYLNLRQERVDRKKEICKYYNLNSYQRINSSTDVTFFDKKINEMKKNNHPMQIYRAIYISDKGAICHLLKNNISPTPSEDKYGEVIKFFFDNKNLDIKYNPPSEVDVLRLLLQHGYKIPKGILTAQIARCYKGDLGTRNIPFAEVLLEYGNLEEIRGGWSIGILVKNLGWRGNLEKCDGDDLCYMAYRLHQAYEYAKRKRNANSVEQ
ncbi:MAG: hypothetical protein AAF518_17845 [Spirochaetota bacterium]